MRATKEGIEQRLKHGLRLPSLIDTLGRSFVSVLLDTGKRDAVMYRTNLLDGIRYRLGNQFAMETAIFDKYFISMHARYNHARQENAGPFALQRMRIGSRTL